MHLRNGNLLLLLGQRLGGESALVWRSETVRDLEACVAHLEGCHEGHVLLDAQAVEELGVDALARLERVGKGAILPLGLLAEFAGRLNPEQEHFVVDALQEFRTPVTVILEFANLLADTSWIGSLNKRQRDYVNRIHTAAGGLSQRIEDFRNSLALHRRPVQARGDRPDLRAILERLACRARARELPLAVELPEHALPIEAPTVLLERALEALTEWALARPTAGGTIHLRILRAAGVIEIELAYPAPTPSRQDVRVLAQGTVRDGLQRRSVTKVFGVGVELARSTALALDGELLLEASPEGGGIFRLRLPEACESSSRLAA